jgi:hypothetical protein
LVKEREEKKNEVVVPKSRGRARGGNQDTVGDEDLLQGYVAAQA